MNLARPSLGFALVLLLAGMSACSNKTEDAGAMKPQPFGTTADGTEVFLYTLKNHSGMEAKITNYGGIVVSLRVPDRLFCCGTRTLCPGSHSPFRRRHSRYNVCASLGGVFRLGLSGHFPR